MWQQRWTSHNIEWKKPATKEQSLTDSIYIKHKNRQKESILLEDWTVVTFVEARNDGSERKGASGFW